MLWVQVGVVSEADQKAAYIEGWVEAMKEDSRAIFRAASEAQKAVDYIMACPAETIEAPASRRGPFCVVR